MMNRQEKLNKLKNAKVPITADGKPFIEALDKKLKEFSDIFGEGVDINSEELFKKLGEVELLKDDISKLTTALERLKFPDYPKKLDVSGLQEFIKALKDNKIKVDISTITPITELVGNLIDKVEQIAVPKQGQEPGDYVPMRRVMLVGKRLMYDDSFYTGGGGGSSGSSGGGVDPVGLKDSGGATIDPATSTKQSDGSQKTQIVDSGGQSAEVNTRTDGIVALEVSDDMTSAETFRQALVASTDTTITFSQPVRLIRVKNESLTATVFVRDGAISSDTPSNAEIIGIAPVLNLPTTEYLPYKTTTVHLRSAGTPTVCVTGMY